MSCSSSSTMNSTPCSVGPNKGAYWASWENHFPPADIEVTLFTHVYYAFVSPSKETYKLEINKKTADGKSTIKDSLKKFTTTLHKKNPAVKTMLSIGGYSDGSTIFSPMASSEKSRRSFIHSTIEVARKFGFDGLDLDWEFPDTQHDMDNLGQLLHEWRVAVKREAEVTSKPQLLLSAATFYNPKINLENVDRSFPVVSINNNLDWINVMCYDYHGSWDKTKTGAHAALYDPPSNIVCTSFALKAWMQEGIRKDKLVMGLPLYGKTWKLQNPSVHGIGAPAVDVGPGKSGIMTYAEIVNFNEQNHATNEFDMSTVSAYSFAGTSWIGYDDVQSTKLKVEYARGLEIGGYFFWAVHGDRLWEISRQASDTWNR